MRHLLGLIDPAIIVFAPYFLAVLVAGLVGGLSSGLVALLLGALSAWWSFLPPTHAFFPIARDQAISLLIYCTAGAIFVAAAESHRRLLRHYYEREQFNGLIISELHHRLRNKLATVQAVLRRDLPHDDNLFGLIAGRLAAIARTDELILRSDDEGAEIGDIVKSELGPYGPSRIAVMGNPIVLPPTLALSLTLVLHELATNAAKYGALSTSQARLDVNWTINNSHVQLMWMESGGPAVRYPAHKGFGSELFQRALLPFHGRLEPEFMPDGFRCNIVFAVPRDRRTAFAFKARR